jgi:DNA-binding transcriptional MerR regulator
VFSIGEFSRITGLTVKTLRFYHEQGLLVPSCVDEGSGYRYYDPSKIETARVIAFLRGLDFPLDEIGRILRDAGDDADLLDVMERRRGEILATIRRQREVVRSLDELLSREKEARRLMANATFEVGETVVSPLRIAGVRMRGKYSQCGEGFARIGRRFGRHIAGKPMMLHHEAEYRDEDADYEACMPVRAGEAADGITVRELPGGRCVTLMHKGPYDDMGRSYAKILGYIRQKGYEVVLPTREVYLKGPGMIFRGNPRNYLTEIQMLVRDEGSQAVLKG